MALSEKSRTTVYTAFTEWLGEEAAAEMMSQFPYHRGRRVVARSFLHGELATFRRRVAAARWATSRRAAWGDGRSARRDGRPPQRVARRDGRPVQRVAWGDG
ncbi:MAG: hypothetical protein U5R31_05255 [Acidimicrobiia bacterium]|nr:hypothetical protein [Acidimicrobiia bacterium]